MLKRQKDCSCYYDKKASLSKVGSCGVCSGRVAHNSIGCTKYQKYVHQSCSDVPRRASLLPGQ